MKTCLLGAFLFASATWAQDACSEKCSNTMTTCIGSCGGEQRCSTGCTDHMQSCMASCGQRPQKMTQNRPKKCIGANGKNMPCPEAKEPPRPPKNTEDNEVYPNQAAKDLAKDPNFTGK
jgi:hypothetical protein